MSSNKQHQSTLIESFVASFEKLDEMLVVDEHLDVIGWQLAFSEPDQYGFKSWRPIKVETPANALEAIYAKLPARFPRLYEKLVLTYRWEQVDLQRCRLLANPPGDGLTGLLEQMSKDPALWNTLRAAGYIQFAKGPDIDYDPVCFDLSARKKNGDCRIVKIDHEEILCKNRLKVVSEVAPSFDDLMRRTIEIASASNRS
jgi:hypothetical protein